MPKLKVLITVTAYPLPSRSYDELVCTAGVLEDGSWIRIYPVPFKFLNFRKYQWVEISLERRNKDDFRPESHRPKDLTLGDITILGSIDTANYWEERKKFCLNEVYYSLEKLIEDSKNPKNKSLACFKPSKILDLVIEPDGRDWKPLWKQARLQYDLFATDEENKKAYESMIRKIPYKFKYKLVDEDGKVSQMMIEDWEIGALYWNCLARAEGDEQEAIKKVRQKYYEKFTTENDIYLFLGTTKQYHQRRAKNPFVIIGVFYPLKEPDRKQLKFRFE